MVTWDTPNDNDDPITSYNITLTSGDDMLLPEQSVDLNGALFTVSGGRTTFRVQNLTPGNNYNIIVRAVNVLGGSREEAEPFTFPAATLGKRVVGINVHEHTHTCTVYTITHTCTHTHTQLTPSQWTS